jgi:cellulase
MLSQTGLGLLGFAGLAAAHGFVKEIVADGKEYVGYNPTVAPWVPDQDTVGWPSWNTDMGPVYGDQVGHADIVCQINATNARRSATVAAGSNLTVTWTPWPESHHGPVLDYLAACPGGDCAVADKTQLEFFKIAEMGQLRLGAGGGASGFWAADLLIAQAGAWSVPIPAGLRPGAYVLRHEILALHSAYAVGGAQFYPQCINLEITGDGTATPAGVPAQQLYTPDHPGVVYGIYNDESKPVYPMPGPPLYNAEEK